MLFNSNRAVEYMRRCQVECSGGYFTYQRHIFFRLLLLARFSVQGIHDEPGRFK